MSQIQMVETSYAIDQYEAGEGGGHSGHRCLPCVFDSMLLIVRGEKKVTVLCNAKNNEIRYLLRISSLTLIVIFYLCTNEKFP